MSLSLCQSSSFCKGAVWPSASARWCTQCIRPTGHSKPLWSFRPIRIAVLGNQLNMGSVRQLYEVAAVRSGNDRAFAVLGFYREPLKRCLVRGRQLSKRNKILSLLDFLANPARDIEIFGMFGPGNLGDEAMRVPAKTAFRPDGVSKPYCRAQTQTAISRRMFLLLNRMTQP